MSNRAQRQAIKNYRRRLKKRGLARFDVLGLSGDRALIRSLARKLAHDDPEAKQSWPPAEEHDGSGLVV